jgi:predicted dehydrogenase
VLKRVPEVEHVACYDIVQTRSEDVARQFAAVAHSNVDALLADVDAISVVVPTVKHCEVSLRALGQGKSLFLEKPIAASLDEAEQIVDAARESRRVLQIGHVERFNAAIRESLPHIDSPQFIEVHRLAPFTVRGIDVSVVMDLMIHDLDLMQLFTGAQPVDVRAKGAAVLTDEPDIVNARLEYEGGCVANLTASRVSIDPLRKVRIFSTTSYLSIDLLKGVVRHCKKRGSFESAARMLQRDKLNAEEVSLRDLIEVSENKADGEEPLFEELRSFCRTIANGEQPAVTGEDGLRALRLASQIQQKVREKPIH